MKKRILGLMLSAMFVVGISTTTLAADFSKTQATQSYSWGQSGWGGNWSNSWWNPGDWNNWWNGGSGDTDETEKEYAAPVLVLDRNSIGTASRSIRVSWEKPDTEETVETYIVNLTTKETNATKTYEIDGNQRYTNMHISSGAGFYYVPCHYTYSFQVKAVYANGAESDWSDTLTAEGDFETTSPKPIW